ncbi:MAG: nucleotidyltransferase domain-containing protein [Cyanobacteria bacterium J06626_18]
MPSDVSPGKFGLKQSTIDQINAVFARYPSVEKAIIYGSRAKGNYRKGSDIDLTLVGAKLKSSQLALIWLEMDDLLLPYLMDISLLRQIDNPDLIEHINRVGVTFYEKAPS